MAGLIKRGKTYYALFYKGDKQKRVSLKTTSLQIAKEKVRQIESALCRDEGAQLPDVCIKPSVFICLVSS